MTNDTEPTRNEFVSERDAAPETLRARYGVIALSATKNKLFLVAPALGTSAALMFGLLMPFAPYSGLFLPMAAFVSGTLIGTWLSGLYFFWPPKGREFLERIERVFGPKTRATIWESYNPERPLKVDVIRTAKEVGEYHLDD